MLDCWFDFEKGFLGEGLKEVMPLAIIIFEQWESKKGCICRISIFMCSGVVSAYLWRKFCLHLSLELVITIFSIATLRLLKSVSSFDHFQPINSITQFNSQFLFLLYFSFIGLHVLYLSDARLNLRCTTSFRHLWMHLHFRINEFLTPLMISIFHSRLYCFLPPFAGIYFLCTPYNVVTSLNYFVLIFGSGFCCQWVVTNLRESSPSGSSPSSFSWVFDLNGIAEMYQSYEETSLWYATLKLHCMVTNMVSFLVWNYFLYFLASISRDAFF